MSAQDRVPGAAHMPRFLRPTDGGFEAYAIELDELLSAADEPPVPDDAIRAHHAAGRTAVQAAAEVIRSRVRAPEPQPAQRNPRGSLWHIVMPLMERPNGCSGREARDALRWKHIPGPYFFRRWTADAGRAGELEGWVEGRDRRFRLPKEKKP